jgi:hypothetical protein
MKVFQMIGTAGGVLVALVLGGVMCVISFLLALCCACVRF